MGVEVRCSPRPRVLALPRECPPKIAPMHTPPPEQEPAAESTATLPELLTVAEVARWLKLTPVAVYRRVARGTIPGVRRCGENTIRFDAAILREWSAKGGSDE